jgi:CBS domain-containing protein
MKDSATRLADIMTRSVLAIPPNTTLDEAHAMMREARIHHLVVMKAGRVAGVLAQRDVDRALLARIPNDDDPWSVEELMSSRVVVGAPDMTVREAAGLLRGHAIGCLPIMDDKQLVGIVTTSDLLDLLANRPVPRPVDAATRDPEIDEPIQQDHSSH